MKFIALDVNVGDSFILAVDGQFYIVDGGQSENGIVSKIIKNNINHADVIICTHYDSDHLNGIIGIMKSRSIQINELWLPDIFGDIALTLSSDVNMINEILNYNINLFVKFGEQEKTISNFHVKDKFKQSQLKAQNSYENINIKNLFYSYEILNLYNFHPKNIKPYISQRILKKIIKLVIVSIKTGAHIRWLKYIETEQMNQISMDHNLFAYNSFETSIKKYDKDQFILALYCLTVINKESLVFLYHSEATTTPDVLFTADSDLKFIKKNILLRNNSIVTAPHHGSIENKNVYGIITGNDLIYVRSDRSQTTRPCYEYTKLKQKYCTICRNKGLKQQVTLEYNGKWNTNNNQCHC